MKTEMRNDAVFVFGSNLSGIHGAGSARVAYEKFGAELYVGEGLTGQAYALPTKGKNITPMHFDEVVEHIDKFIQFAKDNPHKHFKVTCVGCGLAGYMDNEIAPKFKEAPDNCYFDTKWKDYLGDGYQYWGTF